MKNAFISKKDWNALVADFPISCEVIVTKEDGTKYKNCFVLESVDPKNFEEKMDACRDFLLRTLMAGEL